MQPLFFSALDLPAEGPKLLEHYSAQMPEPDCQNIWASLQAPYTTGAHTTNAINLYNALLANPQAKPLLIDQLVNTLKTNHTDTLPQAANYYSAIIADNSLWQSIPLRSQNGQWTVGIRTIINNYATDTALASFFDSWAGATAALTACTSPQYKLATVYQQAPATALHDMSAEASSAEIIDILSAMDDLTTAELGAKLVAAGGLEHEINNALTMGTSGDTISLAEHHLYGSSRLGLQRYDSTSIANILHIPTLADERRTLRHRVPWYSYPFADLVDSTQRSPYAAGLSGNAYLHEWKTTRTLGRRYYEMTDHLGNVLATVLDRKTGAGELAGSSGTLYDHWSADLASTADYYPGGMMMPGRNTEYSWSRMGMQGQQKDDEVYGKGNVYAYKYRMNDARINRFFSPDPLHAKYPHNSDYAFAENRITDSKELEGLEAVPTQGANPWGYMAQGWGQYMQAGGAMIDKAFVSVSATVDRVIENVKVTLGVGEANVKTQMSVTKTITARTNLKEFFTPTSGNTPAGPVFKVVSEEEVSLNTVVEVKANPVKFIEMSGSNTTTFDLSNSEVKNAKEASVGSGNVGLFYNREENKSTITRNVGAKVEAKKQINEKTTITFGAKVGVTVDEKPKK